jgi:ATP-binding cassette subfamily B multidrug efflux pump
MFRVFETFIDPFQPHDDSTPPAGAWRFLRAHLRPFRAVIVASLAMAALGAILEVWLIGYAGRLVDTLAATPRERLWAEHIQCPVDTVTPAAAPDGWAPDGPRR